MALRELEGLTARISMCLSLVATGTGGTTHPDPCANGISCSNYGWSGHVVYEFTQHARDVLAAREIPVEWVERAVFAPELTEEDERDPELLHSLVRIPENAGRVLRVVLKRTVEPVLIVTVYFDRAMRGKL